LAALSGYGAFSRLKTILKKDIDNQDAVRQSRAMKTNNNNSKNNEISKRILAKVASGMSVKDAMNAVLGAGAFEKVVGEIYDSLAKN
jgi:protein required for attachment to host cells